MSMEAVLYALADAVEINLVMNDKAFSGSRKAVMELFEGYSPTVISSIDEALMDENSETAAVRMQVFGNLGLVVVAENRTSTLSLFVIDRSKAPKEAAFQKPKSWSRQELYLWLEVCTKAVYSRSLYDTVWAKLPNGIGKLKAYNEDRKAGVKAKEAHTRMWYDV